MGAVDDTSSASPFAVRRDDRASRSLAAYGRESVHETRIAVLLMEGADPKGNTALMGVAFKGESKTAERLLAEHCDVDAMNAAGQTALMMGALFGRTAVVQLLMAHGADPRVKDAAGNTALALAAQQGNAEMVALLAGNRR